MAHTRTARYDQYRGNKRKDIRIRVGDTGSLVAAGDPIPNPEGGYYRTGQFAPLPEELSSDSLARASEAGMLSNRLPIFDGDEVSHKKLEEWNPNLGNVHFDPEVPKFASAIITDAMLGREGLLEALNLIHVDAGTREEQDGLSIYGEIIIKSEHYSTNHQFTSRIKVFPSFYKYVAAPLVGKLPGRDGGISVASYAVFHTVGHLLFAKMIHDGRITAVGKVLEQSGWTKHPGAESTTASFLEFDNTNTAWSRDKEVPYKTEASKFLPEDDFAEAFALFFAARRYLENAFPNNYEIMKEIINIYLPSEKVD